MKTTAQKVYDLLSKIPQGKVTTYKAIADKIGTKGYRAIGQIVGANQNAPQVPCHRVIRSDGGLGGYAFGIDKKIKILAKEGIKVSDGKVVDFEKKFYKF
ncbi:MAG: MGMT family protein [Rickettsiales bacterium]|nr:MGMT family protein [Rickettsiales bacterium]